MITRDGVPGTPAEDPRALEFAHTALDELGVPRTSDGRRLTLFGRIEALRAGKLDLSRLAMSSAPATPLHPCPRCGLFALVELGAVCPSCSSELYAAPESTAPAP